MLKTDGFSWSPDDIRSFYYILAARYNSSVSNKYNPRWDGGYLRGRKYSMVWPRIANFLKRHECNDFRGFLSAIFEHYKSRTLPTFGVSEKAWNKYLEYRKNLEETLLDRLKEQFQAFRRGIAAWLPLTDDPKHAASIALYDNTVGLSPLFRYLAALQLNLPADTFYASAWCQYHQAADLYKRYWPIPEDVILRLEAEVYDSH